MGALHQKRAWLEMKEVSVPPALGFGAGRGVGVSGMGVIGWDKAGGPRSLCSTLEGTAPRTWQANTGRAELARGGTYPQPRQVPSRF